MSIDLNVSYMVTFTTKFFIAKVKAALKNQLKKW